VSNSKIKKKFKSALYKGDFKASGKLMIKYNWLGWFVPKRFCYLYDMPIGEG